uniref:hypothetical protein n=1 Tax=Algoriphagus sp. TaxID=1872435 RepID=UPI004047558C
MNKEPSSFRDPDSFLEFDTKFYYRKISINYLPQYLHFKESGLKDRLILESYILPFEQLINEKPSVGFANEVLRTEKIPFVSYPYEWSFSQLKTAALLTLKINLIALEYGMILKDSSAYNIQFIGSKAIFIDIASFEIYKKDSGWIGYHQFCKHFLAPLLLSSYKDVRLTKLLLVNLDGIDLLFTRKLLPLRSFFNSGVFLHLVLNSIGIKSKINNKTVKLKENALRSIFIHLTSTIKNLKIENKDSEWVNYYNQANYSEAGLLQKTKIIESFIERLNIKTALDIGANDGKFSILLSKKSIYTVSIDIDELAIEQNFINANKNDNANLLSLHLNFANPTPSIGWDNTERKSFFERGNFDIILALAVIHHFVITYDLTFEMIAERFSKLGNYLIIEFPFPDDEKVEIISRTKQVQFSKYNIENFKSAFEKYFNELHSEYVDANNRIIFLYGKKY